MWQVEIDPYCQRVLAKHFPSARRFSDIRDCGAHNLPSVDILSGGFPCQDISNAGKRVGIDGERSGLWSEYARIIRELRPRYVVVENVAALLGRGMERVLGDLAACGYDAEWDCLPAASFGAPHLRERLWILAYSSGVERQHGGIGDGPRSNLLPEGERGVETQRREDWELIELVPGICERTPADWWRSQSRMDRSAHGVPDWMERVHALGNGVLPQIAEWIGRRIVETEQQ